MFILHLVRKKMKNKIHVIMVILSGVFWGSSCLFVDYLREGLGLSSTQISAVRICLAALILNILLIIKGKGFSLYKISLRSYIIAACSGVFSVLAMCLFYYGAMIRTSAAISVILLYTAPVFVMIMSLIFFKERLTAKKIVSFCFAIVGCALVSGIASGLEINALGIFLALMSGFTYSLYGIFTSFFMKENKEPLVFTALNFLFAAIVAIIISKPHEIVRITAGSDNIPLSLLIFFLLALCTAVLPFLLYTMGLVGVKPDVASILAFTEPLTACIFGVFVLGQPMDAFGAVGIICVCIAIVILNVNFKKKTKKSHN
ncbi:MAG: hypothetical protein E7641_05010 [Ruminococcaceae bacterium]|nr:hypothetical protein [Oscillospiraceae bacterium]